MAERLGIKVYVDAERSSPNFLFFNLQTAREEESERFFTYPKIEAKLARFPPRQGYVGSIGIAVNSKDQVLRFSGYWPLEKTGRNFRKLGIGVNAELLALRQLAVQYPGWKIHEGNTVLPKRRRQLRRMGIDFRKSPLLTVEERLAKVEEFVRKQSNPESRKRIVYWVKKFFGRPA